MSTLAVFSVVSKQGSYRSENYSSGLKIEVRRIRFEQTGNTQPVDEPWIRMDSR